MYVFWVIINVMILNGSDFLPDYVQRSAVADSLFIILFISMAFYVTKHLSKNMEATGFSKRQTTRILIVLTLIVHISIYVMVYKSFKPSWVFFLSTINLIILHGPWVLTWGMLCQSHPSLSPFV